MAASEQPIHYLQTPPHAFPAIRGDGRIKSELTGSETILMVDDNPVFRELLSLALSAYGYHVLAAANGEEALDCVARHAAPVHVVVTDIVMPVLDGRGLVAALRGWYPRLRVIYMSGHPGDPRADMITADANTRYMLKPFSISHLTQAVRNLLDDPTADRGASLQDQPTTADRPLRRV